MPFSSAQQDGDPHYSSLAHELPSSHRPSPDVDEEKQLPWGGLSPPPPPSARGIMNDDPSSSQATNSSRSSTSSLQVEPLSSPDVSIINTNLDENSVASTETITEGTGGQEMEERAGGNGIVVAAQTIGKGGTMPDSVMEDVVGS